MEKSLLKLCEPRTNPSKLFAFFVCFCENGYLGRGGSAKIGDSLVITRYLVATPQSNHLLCLLSVFARSLLPLFCLAKRWGVLSVRSLQTLGACKALAQHEEGDARILCAAFLSPLKHTPFGFIFVGNQSLFRSI